MHYFSRDKNLQEGFYLIHKMKFYYFTSLTKIVKGFLVLDKQCIAYLTFLKFLLNITQAYNSNYQFTSVLSIRNDSISVLYRLQTNYYSFILIWKQSYILFQLVNYFKLIRAPFWQHSAMNILIFDKYRALCQRFFLLRLSAVAHSARNYFILHKYLALCLCYTQRKSRLELDYLRRLSVH